MRSVPLLNLQDGRIFDSVAAAKRAPHGPELTALAPVAKRAYRAYSNAAPAVDTLPEVALTAAQREAMLHAYDVATTHFSNVRVRLLDRPAAAICPYCAVSASGTLDHYLPKDDYPIYAILSRNLVPSCGPCNTNKRTLVLDGVTGVRAFFNPYYDPIPAVRFVEVSATLHVRTLALSFRLVRPPGFSARDFARVESHFRTLKLAKLYKLTALATLGDRVETFRRWSREGGPAKVAAELAKESVDLSGTLGQSHWQVVLYEKLSTMRDFCDGGFEVVAR